MSETIIDLSVGQWLKDHPHALVAVSPVLVTCHWITAPVIQSPAREAR